jgi:prepilin-type N-terminal cleavage/methylation domain-containing protein
MNRQHLAQRGFTILELVVVMGLLTVFSAFLIQLMSTSIGLFNQGERGQDLSDRADAAARALERALNDMVGPGSADVDGREPATRLLVQWVASQNATANSTNSAKSPGQAPPRVQALRATVRLDDTTETNLLRQELAAQAKASAKARTPGAVEERMQELLDATPRAGRADMLLVARPSDDPSGAFLVMRRVLRLPGQRIPIDRQRDVGLMEVAELGGTELPWGVIDQLGEVIAGDLLHVEFALWSQFTRGFDQRVGDGGPEFSWDSARAGLFPESNDPKAMFGLDLGPQSLTNLADDVFPRWVKLTVVVAAPNGSEAILAVELRASDKAVDVLDEALLPDGADTPYVKIGREWVRLGGLEGRSMRGLVRGQRGTKAVDHPAGTRVRVGRTVELFLKVPHGKDCWNGD